MKINKQNRRVVYLFKNNPGDGLAICRLMSSIQLTFIEKKSNEQDKTINKLMKWKYLKIIFFAIQHPILCHC